MKDFKASADLLLTTQIQLGEQGDFVLNKHFPFRPRRLENYLGLNKTYVNNQKIKNKVLATLIYSICIYDKNAYNVKYKNLMIFFIGCITTFGFEQNKYFVIDLLCLLGKILFELLNVILLIYGHISDLKWGNISICRRIFNFRDRVNIAPSTNCCFNNGQIQTTLGDEWNFEMLAFKLLFFITGCCLI
ncbi:hypothetical protein ACJIZ3_019867 [Penstemon smallii]|uniref:Uncharacterized protein n=1 Tax=Penstemon smallii TaxID=265156 RepID=A0ABD3T2G7_9LAMI